MNWPLAVAIAWVILLIPVGYLIGTALRRADRRERPADLTVERLTHAPTDSPAGGEAETIAPRRRAPRSAAGPEPARHQCEGERRSAPDRVPALPAKRSVADSASGETVGDGEV